MPRQLKYSGNIWRLFTAQALSAFTLWVPIWVVFLQGRGVSLTQIGVLEAFAWLLTAFLEVPTGGIADRWGRKASIALGRAAALLDAAKSRSASRSGEWPSAHRKGLSCAFGGRPHALARGSRC